MNNVFFFLSIKFVAIDKYSEQCFFVVTVKFVAIEGITPSQTPRKIIKLSQFSLKGETKALILFIVLTGAIDTNN